MNLAVIGLGWWGGVLADALDSVDGAGIVSCFARSESTRTAFAEQRGIRAAGNYEDVLADDDIDGVLLATSHQSHAELIEQAAAAGKHVFVEKPFTLNVAEGKRAIAAAEEAGVTLQVGHNKRRQPANRRIKELITAGDIGSVVLVETHQTSRNALSFDTDYWRADRDESPLGSMTSLGVHMLDTMHYLLGPVERVSAVSTRTLPETLQPSPPPIDHVTMLLLEFVSGQLGYLGTSFVVPPSVTVTVRGTDGTLWNEWDGTKLYHQRPDERTRESLPVETADTIADQLGEFVAAIDGGPAPETGGAEGLEVIAVLETAIAAVASGQSRSVDEFR